MSRKCQWLACSVCGEWVSTSSNKGDDYICIKCLAGMGLAVNKRGGSTYTTLSAIPAPVFSFGKCQSCKRKNQELSNNLCPDCRFYGISDVDPILSERGRVGKGNRKAY